MHGITFLTLAFALVASSISAAVVTEKKSIESNSIVLQARAETTHGKRTKYDDKYGDYYEEEDYDDGYIEGDVYRSKKGEICRGTKHYCRHHWNNGRGHHGHWRRVRH